MIDCEFDPNSLQLFEFQLHKVAKENAIPLVGTFELTPRCNFNCKMCYIHLTNEQANSIGRELTNEEWLNIARDARDAGMLYLTLTGGEIFSRPRFKELYIELSKMGFLITLLTNGSLIDESTMEWLSEYPPYQIRITLYGMSNETYYSVCGIENGYNKVMHAIELIREAKIPLKCVGTIIDLNLGDLQKMYQYCSENCIPFKHTIAMFKPVRGAKSDVELYRLNLEKMPQEVAQAFRNRPPFSHHENPMDDCGSYRKGFWITWNGKMQICASFSDKYVSILSRTFLECWNDLLKQLLCMSLPKKCIDCKYERYCNRCPGTLFAECGDSSKPTNDYCERAKRFYEKVYEEK